VSGHIETRQETVKAVLDTVISSLAGAYYGESLKGSVVSLDRGYFTTNTAAQIVIGYGGDIIGTVKKDRSSYHIVTESDDEIQGNHIAVSAVGARFCQWSVKKVTLNGISRDIYQAAYRNGFGRVTLL
jgi:hypothetical protein